MKIIILPCGRETKVDDDDFSRFSHIKWRSGKADQNSVKYYAHAYFGGRKIYLHRLVMGEPGGRLVDHRNGDGLDNQKHNLRIASRRQNNANRPAQSSTGYRGVFLVESGRYRASISDRTNGKKSRQIGTFDTAEQAARAYDVEALREFGEFAQLNFPHGVAA